jgi:hypothetical protein
MPGRRSFLTGALLTAFLTRLRGERCAELSSRSRRHRTLVRRAGSRPRRDGARATEMAPGLPDQTQGGEGPHSVARRPGHRNLRGTAEDHAGEYLADRWLPAIEATVRPTFAGYRAHARVYVIPSLGSIPLQSVTTDRLSTFYLQLHRTGGRDGTALAPATVRRVHATLHRAFRDAMSWGYLNRNPAALAVKPKQRSAGSVDMRTWTADELRVR